MRYLIPLAIIITFLAGCASQNNAAGTSPKKENTKSFTLSPDSGTAPTVRVTPIRKVPPEYPTQAQDRNLQGCVMTLFEIDARGRPNHIQALESVPNGVFDQAAVRAISKWRFQVTDLQGHPTTSGSDTIGQEIVFSLGYGSSQPHSIINWICQQPPSRTVIVIAAPTTAGLNVSDKVQNPGVSVVQIPNPHHKPLVNGWVNVKFCIDNKGQVENANPYKASPRGLYNHAAVAALESWKFSARKGFGSLYERTCGLSYHIRIIGQNSLAHGPAVVEQRPTAIRTDDLALPKGPKPHHGRVTLSFCIDKNGKVSDAKAIKSKPAGVFDKAAIQILHLWSYWPKTVDGKAMRTCNMEESIAFRLGRGKLVWAYPGHT